MARERLDDAELALLEVREVFRSREIAHDMAFVDLDLALLYLRQGQIQRIKLLAAEMLKVFRARKTHREVIAAIMLFRDAAALERLSVEWIKELGRFLESSRQSPDVKFRPPR